MSFFQEIWDILQSPPSWKRTFIFMALAASGSFFVTEWAYERQIALLNQEISSLKAKPGQEILNISKIELSAVLGTRMGNGVISLEEAEERSAGKPDRQKKIREAKKTYSELMKDAIGALEKDQLNVFYEKIKQLNDLLHSAEFKKMFPDAKSFVHLQLPHNNTIQWPILTGRLPNIQNKIGG